MLVIFSYFQLFYQTWCTTIEIIFWSNELDKMSECVNINLNFSDLEINDMSDNEGSSEDQHELAQNNEFDDSVVQIIRYA